MFGTIPLNTCVLTVSGLLFPLPCLDVSHAYFCVNRMYVSYMRVFPMSVLRICHMSDGVEDDCYQ